GKGWQACEEKDGAKKKPAAGKKPAAEVKKKPGDTGLGPDTPIAQETLSIGGGKNQSYIQHMPFGPNTVKKLVVSVSLAQAAKLKVSHKQLVEELLPACKQAGATKASVLAARQRLQLLQEKQGLPKNKDEEYVQRLAAMGQSRFKRMMGRKEKQEKAEREKQVAMGMVPAKQLHPSLQAPKDHPGIRGVALGKGKQKALGKGRQKALKKGKQKAKAPATEKVSGGCNDFRLLMRLCDSH
ncbi:unnamed protein product, partial [Cladocopium goreaui]